MKSKFFLSPIFYLTIILILYSCEKEQLQPTELKEIPDDTQALVVENIKVKPVTVAMIVKDGYELYFDVINTLDEEENDIVIREKAPENIADINSPLEKLQGNSPFSIFISLTDSDVPVPQYIAQTTDTFTIKASNRKIDTSNRLYVSDKHYFEQRVEARACTDVGSARFRNDYCGLSDFGYLYSSPETIQFCDEGTWTRHIRSSWFGEKLRPCSNIFTWTNVICGPMHFDVFYYKHDRWNAHFRYELSNGVWRVLLDACGSNLGRRVERTALGGSLRAFTRFNTVCRGKP